MRGFLAVACVLAASVAACGGDVTTGGAGGGAATSSTSSTSTSGAVCTPGSTKPCTCHQGSTQGTETCLPDGSGWGSCAGDCACPQGRGDGCCPGDGVCCACVLGCDPNKVFEQDSPTDALIACACAAGVCAKECATECAGNGIGADCAPCVKAAGMGACQAQYQACGGM